MPLGCPMVDFIIINSHLAKSSSQGCVIPDAIGNAIHCLFYSTNFLKCRVFTILPKDHVLSSFRRVGRGPLWPPALGLCEDRMPTDRTRVTRAAIKAPSPTEW